MNESALYSVLPKIYGDQIQSCSGSHMEEIRLRVGQPACIRCEMEEKLIWPCVEHGHLEELIQRASRFSAYACADSLREGYLSIEGGHRIGVCGTGHIRDGELISLRLPTSVSIRIANQVQGCAETLYQKLIGSVLILGPPGRGKTTLLRDLIVHLSEKGHQRVGLVDERGEIAACVDGKPQLWVGSRTDILVNVRKDRGIMMLLRTMNPQWIAVDEITAERDIQAMEQASYCGIRMIATAHAGNISDLRRRPLYRRLMETGLFSQAAVILPDRSYRVEELP